MFLAFSDDDGPDDDAHLPEIGSVHKKSKNQRGKTIELVYFFSGQCF